MSIIHLLDRRPGAVLACKAPPATSTCMNDVRKPRRPISPVSPARSSLASMHASFLARANQSTIDPKQYRQPESVARFTSACTPAYKMNPLLRLATIITPHALL